MLLLYAQIKGSGYTGHCVVMEARDPQEGAGMLILKLKQEGAKPRRAAIGHMVYEQDGRSDPLWVWMTRRDAEEGRFKGCLDTGVGAYYRNGKEEVR